jgi:uncharacterized metal-binding protein
MPTSGITNGDPNPIEKEHVMASKVNRRRFLKSAATGIAAGAAVQVAGSALAAENPPIPVPDAQTKPAAAGTDPPPVCCGAAAQVIFACSGSADVGKIADLAARNLMEQGAGKMSCLAGVGGRVKGIMETTRAAQTILAIDGCPLHCARNTLEQAGFKKFEHLCLSDLGMTKGKTAVTEEAVAKVASQGKAKLPK